MTFAKKLGAERKRWGTVRTRVKKGHGPGKEGVRWGGSWASQQIERNKCQIAVMCWESGKREKES